MSPGKDLIVSKVFWGALLAFLGPIVLRYLNFDLLKDSEALSQAIITFIGAILAIYGRTVASTRVKSICGIRLNGTGDGSL